MASHNTVCDAANTAVRAFLTEVGKLYWKKTFNITSGPGKRDWDKIRKIIFKGECCYCGAGGKLQIEHLIMCNREEAGLHHPGNVAPTCVRCNKRPKDKGKPVSWEKHLRNICKKNGGLAKFPERRKRIVKHMKEFDYPMFSPGEQLLLQNTAETLYQSIKTKIENTLRNYTKTTKACVRDQDAQGHPLLRPARKASPKPRSKKLWAS